MIHRHSCHHVLLLLMNRLSLLQMLHNWTLQQDLSEKSFLFAHVIAQQYMLSLRRSSASLTIKKKLSRKTWWFFLTKFCIGSWTTRYPRFCSVIPCCFFQVYTWKSQTYPLDASAQTHTLIPRFTGFTGKYYFMPRCPLNLTMASSRDKFLPGHSVSTIFNNMIQNGANFEQLVMSWIFLHNLSCVGIQMKVLRQFVKMIFWHAFSTDRTPMSGSLLQ